MRKPHEIMIDRVLLLSLLHLAEPHGLLSDVKLQQLVFLSELQMIGKGLKGFHFEFVRFAYGAFSKDLDNDLLSLRRKERIENFSVTEQSEEALQLLEEVTQGVESNGQIMEILQSVVATYAPQDNSEVMKSVEAVEICPVDNPLQKFAIRDISFHSILLVPTRIEVTGEFTVPSSMAARLNTALGY